MLYPVFDPNPEISTIPFGENMIFIDKNGLKIYHHHSEINENLTQKVNEISLNLALKFPIKNVLGGLIISNLTTRGYFLKIAMARFLILRCMIIS